MFGKISRSCILTIKNKKKRLGAKNPFVMKHLHNRFFFLKLTAISEIMKSVKEFEGIANSNEVEGQQSLTK